MRCVIVSSRHCAAHGGIGAHIADFVRAAIARGWTIDLFTRAGDQLPPGARAHIITTPDESPEFASRLPALRRIELVRPYRYGMFSLAVAEALLESDVEPDVISFVDCQAEGLLSLTSRAVRERFAGVPMIIEAHEPMRLVETLINADPTRFGRSIYQRWEREAMLAADGVVAPSQLILDELDVPPPAVNLGYPVFDPSLEANRSIVSACSDDDRRTIILAGGIEPKKGVDIWARSLNVVLREHPDITAIVYGADSPTAPDGTSMLAYVRSLLDPAVADRFAASGPIPRASLIEQFQRAAILVVPSRFESFSRVAAEAIMCGCPVIASDRVGMTERAPGLITVPVCDDGALAEAQLHVLADQDGARRRTCEIRDALTKNTDPQRYLDAYAAFTRSIKPALKPSAAEEAIESMRTFLRDIEAQENAVTNSHSPKAAGAASDQPYISIVIPTHNRAELLGRAIASALAQTFVDIEIVISANGCEDDTDAVASEFDDPRIRLVHTPESYLMHDSWRFAFSQARGRYITFLCDDDALHPRAMEVVARTIDQTGAEVTSWGSCSFFWPNWQDESVRTDFSFGPAYSDAVFEVDCDRLLELAYDLRVCHTNMTPKMLNCAVSRELADRIAAAGDELFLPSCPDYSALVTLAAHAAPGKSGGTGSSGGMVHIDAPLRVTGASNKSIGASNTRASDDVTLRFVNQLLEREPDMIVPHMLVTCTPWIAQTYQQCSAASTRLNNRAVNLTNAYGLSACEWLDWRAAGENVDDVEAKFNEALAGPLAKHADAIRAFIDDRREIESESFLGRRAFPEPALGFGPFRAPPGTGRALDIEHIDDFAASIDGWIESRAARLESLFSDLTDLAAGRTIVLYGLGRNGRSLLRIARATGYAQNIAVCDDMADQIPEGCTRIASCDDLDPETHCVLVTPDSTNAIAAKLAARGMQPGSHWFTLEGVAQASAVPA